jgi:signal transduction histidine kinase
MLDLRAACLGEPDKINGVNCVMKTQLKPTKEPSFIGMDYHKRYSVFCVIDGEGAVVERGLIDHSQPGAFTALVKRWPGCRIVFEASMNWHWLYEILERSMESERITLANPYKTRIIAEAQIKTDRVNAFTLAQLLRGNLISSVHIGSRENRQRKEVLRQRAFFVRQRTMLRNRIHRLLGGQLSERTTQLQQANAAKERIFAVIGHDLRSPIASLQTSLELLQSGTLEREEFLAFQEDLRTGVAHARWTLENLMEWGALQLNELQPHPAAVSLQTVTAETRHLLHLQAETKAILVENLVPPEALVWADRHQVTSILRNLLSNALKFTPDGGRVSITTEERGRHWQIAVRDTGIGMTEEQAEKLFQKEREMVSTLGTAKERGLGLGMRITVDFVETNGGSIRVESTPGRGTVFYVTLPKAAAQGDDSCPGHARRPA